MHCFRRGVTSLSLPVVLLTALHAQNTPAPAPQAPPTQTGSQTTGQPAPGTVLQSKNWVRIISAGATLSVLGQTPIGDGSFGTRSTNFELTSSTTGGGHRIGYGGILQVRLPRRYAVAGSFLIHRSFHKTTSDSYSGIDNPNTPLDDRIRTTINSESNVRYWDYALLFRRYGKNHNVAGHRWFVEGGPSFRRVYKISTTRQTTVGAVETNDTLPIAPDRRVARGLTGGVGAQFVDDFGVRLVPEFRFTRWNQVNFDNQGLTSRKNQFEAIVSITF